MNARSSRLKIVYAQANPFSLVRHRGSRDDILCGTRPCSTLVRNCCFGIRRRFGCHGLEAANFQSPTTEATGQESQRQPEEVIFEIIRTKGQAQRHDFLAALNLSRTSLGRILDDMEKTGQIRQIGERKSAFYALK